MGCEASVEVEVTSGTKQVQPVQHTPAPQAQAAAKPAQPQAAAVAETAGDGGSWENFGLGHSHVVLRRSEDGKIMIIIDGKLSHIPNMDVHNNLFKSDIQYGDLTEALAHYDEDTPLSDDAYLLKGDGSDHVYLVDGNEKRWIPGPEMFTLLGFDWDKIQRKSQDEVDAIPTGLCVGQGPNGPFFRSPATTACYVLFNGYLRHVPNPDAWNRVFNVELSQAEFQDVSNGKLVYPMGPPLSGNFEIAKGSTDHVYVVDGDKKFHIGNMEVFNRHHFDQDKIVHDQDDLLAGLTEGHVIV